MKKGVFTIMNYLMPEAGRAVDALLGDGRQGHRPLVAPVRLSGTGKTTLSADPKRLLIGDDEHCWSDDGIFNIEGGCYAKAINLTPRERARHLQALRFGAVLENVVLDPDDRSRRLRTTPASPRTRAAPTRSSSSATRKIPCVAGHPTDVIFLTCDAFGVLPPVSRLDPAQAMYHFISGYTAKVAGTEVGVTEPAATFSPCFGGPFLVWHPAKYAELLAAKLKQHGAHVWLVNTGWSGGAYGTGTRMKLAHTRAIIDAIHAGALADAPAQRDPMFGFDMVTECPGVPAEILTPRNTWADANGLRRSGPAARRPVSRQFQDVRGRRRRRCPGSWSGNGLMDASDTSCVSGRRAKMKVLVFNSGSSSLKFSLLEAEREARFWRGRSTGRPRRRG